MMLANICLSIQLGNLRHLVGRCGWLYKAMIPSCLFAPWVVPVLGGPGAVGLPSGALPHGLRPVSAPARLSQDKGILGSILGLISWQLLRGNDFVTKQTSSIWACRCQSCQMGTLEEISLSCYNCVVSQDYEVRVRVLTYNIAVSTPTGGGNGVLVLLMVTVTMLGWL